MAVALAGCAGTQRVPPPRGELVTPWLAITGGRSPGATKTAVSGAERLKLERPVAVAARGEVLVIADAGARMLWRYDRKLETITPLAPYTPSVDEADGVVSLQLDASMRTWLAVPAQQAVEHIDAQGRLLQRWRNDAGMPRPVAVLWREQEGDLLVADGATLQIVSLDRRGAVRPVALPDPPLKSIGGLAQGPERLYVLDPLAQQVVALGPQGERRETIGYGYLVLPRALAADRAGRVFVADDVDQRIYVFLGEKLVGRARGTFGRIESLALDDNLLYVADSLLGRVHVLKVVPAS